MTVKVKMSENLMQSCRLDCVGIEPVVSIDLFSSFMCDVLSFLMQ